MNSSHFAIQYMTKEKLNEIFFINFISPTLISQQLLKQKEINKGSKLYGFLQFQEHYVFLLDIQCIFQQKVP